MYIKISFKKQSAKLDGDRPGTNGYGSSIGSEPSYDASLGYASGRGQGRAIKH